MRPHFAVFQICPSIRLLTIPPRSPTPPLRPCTLVARDSMLFLLQYPDPHARHRKIWSTLPVRMVIGASVYYVWMKGPIAALRRQINTWGGPEA